MALTNPADGAKLQLVRNNLQRATLYDLEWARGCVCVYWKRMRPALANNSPESAQTHRRLRLATGAVSAKSSGSLAREGPRAACDHLRRAARKESHLENPMNN